jgi:hypothetical protein
MFVCVLSNAGSCTITAVNPPLEIKDAFSGVLIPMARDVNIENFIFVYFVDRASCNDSW